MSGLGGVSKSPNGGAVQLRLTIAVTRADLATRTRKIVTTVGKARRNMATMDLVGFPKPSGPFGDKLSQASE
jgi:formamidase